VAAERREVADLREEMARLDADLLTLLDKRAALARKLGAARKDQPSLLPLTDHAVVRDLVAKSTGDMPHEALRAIFWEIYSACLTLELPVKVAFVGPEGEAGHAAARGRFGRGANLVRAETTADALGEVSQKRAEFAVVPFETSNDGPVHSTILALSNTDLRIVEVLDVTFEIDVMNRTGRFGDVQKIYATAADCVLCRRFLASLGSRVAVLDVQTPLVGCQLAVEDHTAGVLVNQAFGAPVGLSTAERNVLDRGTGRVRYAVAGPRPSGRTGNDVTAVVFSVHDAPGSLLDVLRVFAERGINLTNVISHPVRGDTWTYLFYVEMAGHFTDRPLVMAFEEMKRLTRFFKLLGSYPAP
jgi:chorismate mutase/prephenate dehydratase